MEALFLGKPPPGALLDLTLCRDVYHCAPSLLDEQEAERVLNHLVVLNAEAKVQRARGPQLLPFPRK